MANTTKHIIAAITLKNAVNIKPDVVVAIVVFKKYIHAQKLSSNYKIFGKETSTKW